MGEMWSMPMFRNTAAANSTFFTRSYFSAWLETSMLRYRIPEDTALAKCRSSSRGSGVVRWDSNFSTPSYVSMPPMTPLGACFLAARYSSKIYLR